ncbi:hypothetical protein [Paenibacillus alginolyticus]|uniref:Uncharacterized protein n=2 Tax=Paenibacillus alginolyticus TaxID=59839 RepID=A0ABT4GH48_9BACL|nr:hypothetical protein [Paenibacillus alginolyticus]MCY9695518.1 hypothetical protein [Paenibacillus alginolyticus]
MENSSIQHSFEGIIRQLQLFHDDAIRKLTMLEEENQGLKRNLFALKAEPSNEQSLSLPFVLDLLSEMKLEDSIGLFLQLLFKKIEPEHVLEELAVYLNQQLEKNESFRFDEVMIIFIQVINNLYDVPKRALDEFIKLLKKVFISDYDDLDEMEAYYRTALEAMVSVQQRECKKRIGSFLKAEFDLTASNLINSNHPELITKYMYTLLFHTLENELSTFYKQRVLPEWPFLDANVDKERFYRFLWYGVLQKVDGQLVGESKEALAFLGNFKDPEIELYTVIYDLRNRSKTIKHEDLSNVEKLLAATSFYKLEKQAIGSMLQQEVKTELEIAIVSDIASRPKWSVVDEVLQIKKNTKECPHCDHVRLVIEEVQVNVYQNKAVNGAIVHEVLRCSVCQRVYLNGKDIPKLKKNAGSREVKVNLDPAQYRPEEKKSVISKPAVLPGAGVSFVWPSTAAEETSSPGSSDGLFKEESNLHRLGYRITGLNRIQRWDILVRKVIPRLPLKEIVYTVANNVKIRKRQVGGKHKFAYAISEWEHDLERLKQEYYKSNFVWPQY